MRTKIEWCDYTINPVKGLCPVDCKDNLGKSYCYARRMYKRFKWNPEIRYEELFYYPGIPGKRGDRYFVGSTMELFGGWIRPEWLEDIFRWVRTYPQRTFIFLTKRPRELPREFPQNCWVGATATDYYSMFKAVRWLPEVKAAKRFISFEPLLESVAGVRLNLCDIDWVIIGAQTPYSIKTAPKIEWIQEIVDACDEVGIPVFLKYNLVGHIPIEKPFYNNDGSGWGIRQEFPLVIRR